MRIVIIGKCQKPSWNICSNNFVFKQRQNIVNVNVDVCVYVLFNSFSFVFYFCQILNNVQRIENPWILFKITQTKCLAFLYLDCVCAVCTVHNVPFWNGRISIRALQLITENDRIQTRFIWFFFSHLFKINSKIT